MSSPFLPMEALDAGGGGRQLGVESAAFPPDCPPILHPGIEQARHGDHRTEEGEDQRER